MFIKIRASNRFLDESELKQSSEQLENLCLQFDLYVQYSQINCIQYHVHAKQWSLRLNNNEWFATTTDIVDIITSNGNIINL